MFIVYYTTVVIITIFDVLKRREMIGARRRWKVKVGDRGEEIGG